MGENNDFCLGLLDALKQPDVIAAYTRMFKNSLKEELDDIKGEITGLRNALKAKDDRIAKLESDVMDLHNKLDDQEQYTRRNTLCVSNIPEKQFEDTTATALKLFNKKMKVPITVADIDRAHRYGKRKPNGPRGIMVKFATHRARSTVFRAKSTLGPNGVPLVPAWTAAEAAGFTQDPAGELGGPDGDQDPEDPDQVDPEMAEFDDVYISESLTDRRQYLMFQCRVARRKHTIKKCWSSDGQILVLDNDGKIIPINNTADLEKTSKLDFNEVMREIDASRQRQARENNRPV